MGFHLAEIFAFRFSTLLEENILILQKWVHDVLFMVVTIICRGGKKSQHKKAVIYLSIEF